MSCWHIPLTEAFCLSNPKTYIYLFLAYLGLAVFSFHSLESSPALLAVEALQSAFILHPCLAFSSSPCPFSVDCYYHLLISPCLLELFLLESRLQIIFPRSKLLLLINAHCSQRLAGRFMCCQTLNCELGFSGTFPLHQNQGCCVYECQL